MSNWSRHGSKVHRNPTKNILSTKQSKYHQTKNTDWAKIPTGYQLLGINVKIFRNCPGEWTISVYGDQEDVKCTLAEAKEKAIQMFLAYLEKSLLGEELTWRRAYLEKSLLGEET